MQGKSLGSVASGFEMRPSINWCTPRVRLLRLESARAYPMESQNPPTVNFRVPLKPLSSLLTADRMRNLAWLLVMFVLLFVIIVLLTRNLT